MFSKNAEIHLFYIVCTEYHSIFLIEFAEETMYVLRGKRMNTDILHVYNTQIPFLFFLHSELLSLPPIYFRDMYNH